VKVSFGELGIKYLDGADWGGKDYSLQQFDSRRTINRY